MYEYPIFSSIWFNSMRTGTRAVNHSVIAITSVVEFGPEGLVIDC